MGMRLTEKKTHMGAPRPTPLGGHLGATWGPADHMLEQGLSCPSSSGVRAHL